MLETLISSKTRIKLLLKFFLNSKATSYLRGLEAEFGDSSNAIRVELNRFEKAGMLTSYLEGNKKYFRANTLHPLYNETHGLLLKYIGFDQIVDTVIERLGDVSEVYVTGAFAQGLDHDVIELVFIGNIRKDYLSSLIQKVEQHISRKIKYFVFGENEMEADMLHRHELHSLLLWRKD
jgi:hypothetical protein